MPKFSLERRVPSCLVTKDLLSTIEAYLKVEMCQKIGAVLGNQITYRISIKEKIGTETLASVSEYTPTSFSDGTKEVQIRWDNGYHADCLLDITIYFDSVYYLSKLKVECNAPTARETAVGIGDAILRLLESHRTYNWIFNPFKIPIITLISGMIALVLLFFGSAEILKHQEQGLFFLSGAAFAGWIYFSAQYFRPLISFDTRRQRLLDRGCGDTFLWGHLDLYSLEHCCL
ncbi:MAG: hypothetical protein M1418_02800 [Deltaproteobacteria bacterium]|nr:hypothetical protein [Deltaproteobacteria bacterium]